MGLSPAISPLFPTVIAGVLGPFWIFFLIQTLSLALSWFIYHGYSMSFPSPGSYKRKTPDPSNPGKIQIFIPRNIDIYFLKLILPWFPWISWFLSYFLEMGGSMSVWHQSRVIHGFYFAWIAWILSMESGCGSHGPSMQSISIAHSAT